MKRAGFNVLLAILVTFLVFGCAKQPPENERKLAEKAFRDAAAAKDCAKADYLAAEELLNQARESVNKKDYEKAKSLFDSVKKKSDEIVKYYQTHPDECLPKKDEKKDGDEVGAKKEGEGVDEKTLSTTDPATDPNWSFPVIHFEFNDYSIREEDKPMVGQIAAWMNNFKDAVIQIEGHADERGSIDFNMSLGEKRAREVMEQLIKQGIDKKRLKIITYGEEKPLDSGHSEEAWFQNRRAEFRRMN